MAEIVNTIISCGPTRGSNTVTISFQGVDQYVHSFDFTQQAVDRLVTGLLAQPYYSDRPTPANAILPIDCRVFDASHGVSGLAFGLGGRYLHVSIPKDQIAHVRAALDQIEKNYSGH